MEEQKRVKVKECKSKRVEGWKEDKIKSRMDDKKGIAAERGLGHSAAIFKKRGCPAPSGQSWQNAFWAVSARHLLGHPGKALYSALSVAETSVM